MCLRKFLVSKKLMPMRKGLPRFFVDKVLFHSTGTNCRGTLRWFEIFQVSKHLWIGGEEALIMIFCQKVKTVKKPSLRNIFVFEKVSGIEKVMVKREGVSTILCR